MTYNEALSYIQNTLRFGSKPGLERIEKLLALMGNPQDKLRIIHVAGTNGKGSTANAVAATLDSVRLQDRALYFALCYGFLRADTNRRQNDTK